MKNSKKEQVLEIKDFAISINPHQVVISEKNGNWTVRFKFGTREYGQIAYLYQQEDKSALENLIILLKASNMVITSNEYLNKFVPFLNAFLNPELQKVAKEEDKKVLEEEKNFHEAQEDNDDK